MSAEEAYVLLVIIIAVVVSNDGYHFCVFCMLQFNLSLSVAALYFHYCPKQESIKKQK